MSVSIYIPNDNCVFIYNIVHIIIKDSYKKKTSW